MLADLALWCNFETLSHVARVSQASVALKNRGRKLPLRRTGCQRRPCSSDPAHAAFGLPRSRCSLQRSREGCSSKLTGRRLATNHGHLTSESALRVVPTNKNCRCASQKTGVRLFPEGKPVGDVLYASTVKIATSTSPRKTVRQGS